MKITADGLHILPTSGKANALYVTGSLGGGTATVGYVMDGTFISLKDDTGNPVTLDIDEQYVVYHGQNMDIVIELAGSTSPDLRVLAREVA